MSDSSLKALGYLIFFTGVGIFSFFDGFRKFRRKRLVENIPTSKIRSMAMGLVEIGGKAHSALKVLKGPFTGRDCVFYKYKVERYQKQGKSNKWVTVASDNSLDTPFYVDDGSGRVLVSPKRCELNLKQPDFLYTGYGNSIDDGLKQFLNQHNIRYQSWFSNSRMRFTEWDIYPEDDIYVLGTAHKDDNFAANFNNRLNEEIARLKSNPLRMQEADTNQDGSVDLGEWDAMIDKLRGKIVDEELKNKSLDLNCDIIIGRGQEEKIFIISEHSEKELILKLGRQAFWEIFGGAILAIGCLAGIYYFWQAGMLRR